jgi:hypothetical protein
MRTLIISYDTYSWIKYVSGMVIENPDLYEVVVVCKDNERDMKFFPKLCEDAVYMQRRYDLFRVAKDVGLKKISNYTYTDRTLKAELDKFIAEISLFLLVSGVDTILYQNNYILRNVMSHIKAKSFAFGDNYSFDNTKFIYLKKETIDKKISLSKFMLGVHENQERKLFPSVEQLYY